MLAEAGKLAAEQAGSGTPIEAPQVVARLRGAVTGPKAKPQTQSFGGISGGAGITARRSGRKTILEVPDSLTREGASAAFQQFLESRFGKE